MNDYLILKRKMGVLAERLVRAFGFSSGCGKAIGFSPAEQEFGFVGQAGKPFSASARSR